MILGVGCDVVQIPRITKIYQEKGLSFLSRIFSEDEIKAMPVDVTIENYIAKRYAAKEAFSKATGLGIGAKFSFRDIEIFKCQLGKPYFSQKTLDMLGDDVKAHVSLSDDWPIAIAYVVISSSKN